MGTGVASSAEIVEIASDKKRKEVDQIFLRAGWGRPNPTRESVHKQMA